MNTPASDTDNKAYFNRTIETLIRLGAVAILVIYCYQIVRPFVIPMVWGVIIAVAMYPTFVRLRAALGDRNALAAILITLLALTILLVPTAMLSETLVVGAHGLAKALYEGTLVIPAPPENVAGWPLIGERLSQFWHLASTNLQEALSQAGPRLQPVAKWLLSVVANGGIALLQFVVAIIVAGAIVAHDAAAKRVAQAIAARLANERGNELLDLARATIRSVARGILGVALIQSLLAGMGFLVMGVPGAGLWALICLLLAVVQIGIFPITIPILIYVFATADTLPAVLFLVWSILIGTLDNVLKPILLGRGVNVPMLVIFIGAIGGFLASGIIGLFIGSVILVLGYQLFLAWLQGADKPEVG
jgi:predicted PurR-regulated permease PerM